MANLRRSGPPVPLGVPLRGPRRESAAARLTGVRRLNHTFYERSNHAEFLRTNRRSCEFLS